LLFENSGVKIYTTESEKRKAGKSYRWRDI